MRYEIAAIAGCDRLLTKWMEEYGYYESWSLRFLFEFYVEESGRAEKMMGKTDKILAQSDNMVNAGGNRGENG